MEAVRAGQSRVLVIRGEPGVGKTALLDYLRAQAQAAGCRAVLATGIQSEMELAFAGLHQLAAPMLDHLPGLPDPQGEALRTAFGLGPGLPPDRFLVGLAVLNLFSAVSGEQPVICLVDDEQWLDQVSAQVLAFVARRLGAESVGIVVATRLQSDRLGGLPELAVEGLREADARALLDSVLSWPLDARVRDQVVAETRGNPLALIELPRGLPPDELAGGFGLPGALPLTDGIEEHFRRRLDALPGPTRRLLWLAAADPVGDPFVVWRAAELLGLGTGAGTPAVGAGLVELAARVRFRHPLVRSAAYRSASLAQRQEGHRALAQAIDPRVDPDRRAWHWGQAVAGPDEEVAAELERSAGRAQVRGGLAAAAAFLDRAALLTPDPARRVERAIAAAQTRYESGTYEAALRLLAVAEAGPLDDLQRARAGVVRAQIAFATSHGPEALGLLIEAAKQLEPHDVALARSTYLDALSASTVVGRLAGERGLRHVAEAARAAPRPSEPVGAPDLLLDGLATAITDGYEAGAPLVKRALAAFRSDDLTPQEGLRWLWFASHAALAFWDDDSWEALADRHLRMAREAGAFAVLPIAINTRIGAHLGTGDLAAAQTLLDEADVIAEATGIQLLPYIRAALAAMRGREPEAVRLIELTLTAVQRCSEGIGLGVAQWAKGILGNALGRYQEALAAVADADAYPEELWFSAWASIELIEAAARCGDSARAAAALRKLARTTQASGTELGRGIEARSRALLADGPLAESLYREAIERLGRTRVRLELARAHLVYGEWLRRERRRVEARRHLRVAHEMLASIGMEAFAERASRELRATGARARKRTVGAGGQLTPHELLIARLASEGLSNPQIGSRLFISPRTVKYSPEQDLRQARDHLPQPAGTRPAHLRQPGYAAVAARPDPRPRGGRPVCTRAVRWPMRASPHPLDTDRQGRRRPARGPDRRGNTPCRS